MIKINATEKTLIKGQTAQLKITGTSKKVTWKSSKKSVVTVNGSGKITAKKKGNAVITAKIGTVSKKCKVTVETPKLSKTSVTLVVTKKQMIKLSGCKHSVKWSSSKSSVAKVKNGVITANYPGNATITAEVHGKKYRCKVKVNPPKITSISLSSNKLSMDTDAYKSLQIKVSPSNALKYYDVSVKSSNKHIVSIDEVKNGKIYLESYDEEANANITVKVGNKTLTCKVTVVGEILEQPDKDSSVVQKPQSKPLVTSLSFDKTSVSLKPNESKMLWFDVDPFTADDYYEYNCVSSDEDIVKVVKVGSSIVDIKAGNKEGEASVTLTIGNKLAICKVKVAKPEVTSVSFNKSEVSIRTGSWALVFFDVNPFTSFDYYDYVWESSDEDIVKIESKSIGCVQLRAGMKTGIAYLTLTVGDKSVICKVTVTN